MSGHSSLNQPTIEEQDINYNQNNMVMQPPSNVQFLPNTYQPHHFTQMDPQMYFETGNYIENRLPAQILPYQQLNTHTNSSDYNGEPIPSYQQTQMHNIDL